MADETTQRADESGETDALKSYPVAEAREREAARVKQSEGDGKKSGAYAPAFNPGFRPDVYIPEESERPEVLTTQGVHATSAAVKAAAGETVSESAASGGLSSGNAAGSVSTQTTDTSDADAVTSRASDAEVVTSTPSAASLLTGSDASATDTANE